MSSAWVYRTASVLLILFSVGHTVGFRTVDPAWGAGAAVDTMKAVSFQVQGFDRSYWDFFVGFGLFVTVFLLFSAILAWQLGRSEGLRQAGALTWPFAICFVAITILSWTYFFVAPGVFSTLISMCLIAGAVKSGTTRKSA